MGHEDGSREGALQRVATWCVLVLGLTLLVPWIPLLIGSETFYLPWVWVPPLAVLRDPALHRILEGWLLANASALMLVYGARRYRRIRRPAAADEPAARRRKANWVVAGGASLLLAPVMTSTSASLIWLIFAGSGPLWQRIMAAAAILAASVPGLTAARQAHRYARRLVRTPFRSPDELGTDPFVLYLRPFQQDEAGYTLAQPKSWLGYLDSPGNTHEEFIARTFRRFARIVAVGRPGEEHPFPGARRFYLPREGWKPVVSDLISRARLVLLVAGTGEGTLWELTESVRLLAPERLLLLVQDDRPEYESFRRAARDAIAARLADLPPEERGPLASFSLPDFPEPCRPEAELARVPLLRGAVRFGAAWTPAFINLGPAHVGPHAVPSAELRYEEMLEDLERALPSDEVPHARRHPVRGWAQYGAAMAGMGVSVVGAASMAGFLFDLLRSGSLSVNVLFALSALYACVKLAGLSEAARCHSRLHTGPVAQIPGAEPYVLFVRPFPGDRLLWLGQPTMPDIARYTFGIWLDFSVEEELEKIFKPYGRLVCLGDPGNGQGLPSGTRLYLPQENWRLVAARAMKHARLVIMATGTAPETAWVMNEAVRLLPPSRLLLIMHRDRDIYEKFRQATVGQVGTASRPGFPRYPYQEHQHPDTVLPDIIHFDRAWQPKFLRLEPLAGRRARRQMIQALLQPILEPQTAASAARTSADHQGPQSHEGHEAGPPLT